MAVGIGFVRDNLDIFHHPDGVLAPRMPVFAILLLSLSAGIGLGLLIARFTRFTVYRFEWAKALHLEFRSLLGPLRNIDIFVFAATSAIAEEAFFRGAVQQAIGIVPWPIQATVMGFMLGGLYRLTGDLTAPIVLHFTINYQNLHFINRYDPQIKLPRALVSGPGQVSS